MYVYRVMSSRELVNRLNGVETNEVVIKGLNTFEYKNEVDYIHFYKFAEHAFINKERFGCVVAKVKLNDDIIPPLEYGLYSDIKTYNDDSLYFYGFPMPEIIIDRSLFSNECIVGFADTHTTTFEISEDGIYPLSFCVERNVPFKGKEKQWWSPHSIYYEYIKSVFPLCNYDDYAVARYLKTIDLDRELMKMAKKIKKKKLIIKNDK